MGARRARHWTFVAALLASTAWANDETQGVPEQVPAPAQTHDRRPSEHLVTAAMERASTKALGDDVFGETLSLATGAVSFRVVDIDLRGKGPPVQLIRSTDASRLYAPQLNRLTDWDLEVPRITTTGASPNWTGEAAASLWRVKGPSPFNRCSSFGEPPDFDFPNRTPAIKAEAWWTGAQLRIPGHSAQALLRRGPGSTLAPNGEVAAHPIVTLDGWAISCLPSTKNGAAGEAFLARSPDGLTYRFDWMSVKPLPVARASASGRIDPEYPPTLVPVFEVSLYATQVTDRFGNVVHYTYSGDALTRIAASDGRVIDFTYAADDHGNPKLTQATVPGSPSRTWTYAYRLHWQLDSVVLPDGSAWRYPVNMPARFALEEGTRYSLRMQSPSGVEAQFDFLLRGKPKQYSHCAGGYGAPYKALDPCWVVSDSLEQKTYSGPGVDATWRYYYRDLADNTSQTVVDADGVRTLHTTANLSNSALDGLVLRTEEGASIWIDGRDWHLQSSRRTTTIEHLTLPARVGLAPQVVANHAGLEYRTVEKRRVIQQDGVTFASTADTFDWLGRPTKTTAVGSGPTRTTLVAFHDDTAAWVLGQSAKTTVNGIVSEETTYNASALPHVRKVFGRVEHTLGYRPDGTLYSRSDGRDGPNFDTTITFGPWKRGLPTSIHYPDGTSVAAEIDDAGQIKSITNGVGAKSCYTYDAMGRLASVAHPSETVLGVCDGSAWNSMHRSFERVHAPDRGLASGHWRELTTTGNARRFVYYDALWRPVLENVYDAADGTDTASQVVTRYDDAGRVVFESYPARHVSDFMQSLSGVRTHYDVLGRAVRVEQDSELGPLVTSTEYMSDGRIRVTSPRGAASITSYLTFDTPSTEWPLTIAHPGGAHTDISRDIFGKPTAITRGNLDGTTKVTRTYWYDGHQSLCRTHEPETGNTFLGYDGAGNLAWSGAGITNTVAPACVSSAAVAWRRVDHVYDTRNRLVSIAYPDGVGNTSHTYTADGLPSALVVDNGDGNVVTTRYQYNRRRLLTRESLEWNAIQWSVDHGFDRNGHLAQQTLPGALTIAFAPNALGQPTRAGDFAHRAEYHPNGALARFVHGNGIVHETSQNARGLPERARTLHGAMAVVDDSYDYDAHANVVAISDGTPSQRGNRDLTYDNLDRLTSANSPMWGGKIHYGYDVLDNLVSVSAPNRSQRFCYDATNRLAFVRAGATVACSQGAAAMAAFGYDAQGNLDYRNNVDYAFDFGNRLRSTTGGVASTYVYDALGRRVRDATTGSRYSVYTQAGQLAFTSDVRKAEYANYVHLGGTLVAIRTWPHGGTQHTVRHQHTDALGTPVAVTDANRNVVERSEYEPYGKVVNRPQKDGVGFTGHVEDAAIGAIYMQQRYFHADLPVALSVDPAAVREGGDNFNRYRYGNHNPYKFTDPDGRNAIFKIVKQTIRHEGNVFEAIIDVGGDIYTVFAPISTPWERIEAAISLVSPVDLDDMRAIKRSMIALGEKIGGRKGGLNTRSMNKAIGSGIWNRGGQVTGGFGVSETRFGLGRGARYSDGSALDASGNSFEVQTVDALSDGRPTPKERAAARDIAERSGSPVVCIPKVTCE